MLSIIIPSYHDPLLHKTIDSLLDNAQGEIEVIAVLDGYWVESIRDDKRVRMLHLGKNRGMRGAINAGVLISRGKYIMRTDEHCMFGEGYDVILCRDCEENWIVTPRRYYLDPVRWKIMEIKPVDYEKLALRKDIEKFEGQKWHDRTRERANVMVDETMAMQGSCWLMHRSWWDRVIGELQTEGYGPHYQDSVEMTFKTWQAGGKLMVNKNTWYAHKHYKFPRTHQYGISEATPGWQYSIRLWKDYYLKEIAPRWGLPCS